MKKMLCLIFLLVPVNAFAVFVPFETTGLYAERFDIGGWQPDQGTLFVGGPGGNNSLAEAFQFEVSSPTDFKFLSFDARVQSLFTNEPISTSFHVGLYTESILEPRNGTQLIPVNSSREYITTVLLENTTPTIGVFEDLVFNWDVRLESGVYWLGFERDVGTTDTIDNFFSYWFNDPRARNYSPLMTLVSDVKYSTDIQDAQYLTPVVPEPSTISLLGLAFCVTGLKRKKIAG